MAIDTSTVAGAIEQVARHMSMVNGTGVTPYSPELILSYLIAAHEAVLDESTWDETIKEDIRTLDGVNGLITEGITDVSDWKSILKIYHESSNKPLPKVSGFNNPLISTTMTGYRGLGPADDPGPSRKLVRFYPLTLTGRVLFQSHRTYDFNDTTLVIPIDWWLHVYHASWQYALDDGTNPGQIKKYEVLYNQRLSAVKDKEIGGRFVSLNPYTALPDTWFDSDDPYGTGD